MSSSENLSVERVSKAPDAGGHKIESSSPGITDGGGTLVSSTSAATPSAEMVLGEVSLVEYCREGMVEEQYGGLPMLLRQAYVEGETSRTLLGPDIAPAKPETLEKRFVEPASDPVSIGSYDIARPSSSFSIGASSGDPEISSNSASDIRENIAGDTSKDTAEFEEDLLDFETFSSIAIRCANAAAQADAYSHKSSQDPHLLGRDTQRIMQAWDFVRGEAYWQIEMKRSRSVVCSWNSCWLQSAFASEHALSRISRQEREGKLIKAFLYSSPKPWPLTPDFCKVEHLP